MTWYLGKLILMLALTVGLIWGSYRAMRFLQEKQSGSNSRQRIVTIRETQMVSPGLRLAVLQFHGRDILVSHSKAGFVRLAEAPSAQEPVLPE
ncbi:flagellar biogenesis protein [Sphingomicrobium astaxanthinifaciens]|uniref:flagellar biogenesis protein n=1 Tax=Sphingomicrobium astaxanthinifaciens TaxID=1227949 RepID=UPI001FCC9D28|nr:flagellar biogenesis protein [Sphingomicrobium astaxanthinifaciens]MCJ7420358.1 flagellar biogenesis protein [Sphingomicrobium astaxanthinifaciens]